MPEVANVPPVTALTAASTAMSLLADTKFSERV
jgi:hypothetical protein